MWKEKSRAHHTGIFSLASFGQFVEEKKYLDGVSHRTARNYWGALKAFHRYHTGNEITEASLMAMAMATARAGMSPGAIHSYARSLNTFLRWARCAVTVPLPKLASKALSAYSPQQISRLLNIQPRNHTDTRMRAVLSLLLGNIPTTMASFPESGLTVETKVKLYRNQYV